MTDDSVRALTRQRSFLSRRQFIKLCGAAAAVLALPKTEIATIATALAASPRLPVVWLEFQDCTGDSESFLRAAQRRNAADGALTDPGLIDLLLDHISVEYHETLMAPSGAAAGKSRADVLAQYAGKLVCIVEGAIPTGQNGNYCTIAGETALSIVRDVTARAAATIALGNCAVDGGLAAASPNPTGATGVRGAVPNLANLVNMPGCPANVVNLVATVVYYVTYGALPRLEEDGRPRFAYHDEVHERCERKRFKDQDQYVLAWGDEGHLQGWCLKRMGCRGPDTDHNCPTVKWNDGACWPIGAGHHCVGCARSGFWDRMTPFYRSGDGAGDDD